MHCRRSLFGSSEPPKGQRNTPPWCLELRPRCGPLKQKAGQWYRGVLEAAERFMARWHGEAQPSRHRRASAVGGDQENGGRGGNRANGRKPGQGNRGRGGTRRIKRQTAVDESRKETADSRQGSKAQGRLLIVCRTCPCYTLVPPTSAAGSNVVFLCLL